MKMSAERFHQIVDLSEIGREPVRYNYGGQDMFDRVCPAVVGVTAYGRFMAAAGMIERDMDEHQHGPDFSALDLADDTRMDKREAVLLFYWPSLELAE